MSKSYLQAVATMIGTIIGVGMFSIPFVIYQSGIMLFVFYIVVLGFIQYYMHLVYAEIFLSTKKKHRVPGYVAEYLGERYKKPALVIVLISTNLTMLSYLIIGGIFLDKVLSPAFGGNPFVYTILMFFIAAGLTFRGLKFIAKTELAMSGILFLVIAIITISGFPHIDISNYQVIDWTNFFLPYGPVFMAIGGMTAVPTVCSLLAHKKSSIKSAIKWGTVIPAFISIVFVFTVVGVSGSLTSPDSLVGLSGVFSNNILLIALIFGLVSIITSYIMFIEATKEVYWWDLRINKTESWALTMTMPMVLFLLGINNLTSVVSLSGAIIGGMVSIIYILLILKVKQKPERPSIINVKINRQIAISLIVLFFLGFLSVLEYIEVHNLLVIFLVLFFYMYSLIKSDKNNSSIYLELLDTAKKTGLVFLFVFVIVLTYGVVSLVF